MVRLLSTWLIAPLAAAALLAGCGSSSGSSGSSSSSKSVSTGTGSTSAGGVAKLPAVSSAVASCKQGVQRWSTLPAGTREKLERICERAGSNNKEEVRKATVEGCRALVEATPAPNGPAKRRALAACAHAGGSKGK